MRKKIAQLLSMGADIIMSRRNVREAVDVISRKASAIKQSIKKAAAGVSESKIGQEVSFRAKQASEFVKNSRFVKNWGSKVKPQSTAQFANACSPVTALVKRNAALSKRTFPQAARNAEQVIMTQIDVAARHKSKLLPRVWNVAKRGMPFAAATGAFLLADYYIGKAMDYWTNGNQGEEDEDKGGVDGQTAAIMVEALVNEMHGLNSKGKIEGLDDDYDLANIDAARRMMETLNRIIRHGGDVTPNDTITGYAYDDDNELKLFMNSVVCALNKMIDATPIPNTLRWNLVHSFISGNSFEVPSLADQKISADYDLKSAVERQAEHHVSIIASFLHDYQDDIAEANFSAMTSNNPFKDEPGEFFRLIDDYENLQHKVDFMLLASARIDPLVQSLNNIQKFTVGSDGMDDESAYLQYFSSLTQRGYEYINKLNNTK